MAGMYENDDARKSAAWKIARQRLGKEAVPAAVEMRRLAHRYRADVVQRMIDTELERGTPERIVRVAVFGLDTLTPTTIRHACALVSTGEVDARRERDTAHATRVQPADRGEFDRLDRLVEVDPDEGLRQVHASAALTADERDLLIAAAHRLRRTHGAPAS